MYRFQGAELWAGARCQDTFDCIWMALAAFDPLSDRQLHNLSSRRFVRAVEPTTFTTTPPGRGEAVVDGINKCPGLNEGKQDSYIQENRWI